MKRILSLLVVFAMVISLIPNVFAAKTEIDMDELLGKLVYLDSIDEIEVSLIEGPSSKTYKWTPEKDGVLSVIFSLPEDVEMDVTLVQGENSIKYSETDDAFELNVVGGTEVSIVVSKTSEAALETVLYGDFKDPYGTEGNPIALYDLENQVKTEGVTWFQCYFGGTTMIVTGEGDFTVTANGQTVAAQNGAVSMAVVAPPRSPFLFTIDQAGEYTVTFEYPVGTMENPAQLVIGENTATLEEGSQGYFYSWTAEANGELTITMPDGDWFYVVNNLTAYVYGDYQWSDSDPVMKRTTISVKAGDEIEVQVNTYDPTVNPWDPNPAGTITFTAAFEEAKYTVGDLDGNEVVDIDDAIWLLLHTMLGGENYPLNQPVDYDKNNTIDIDDAIWLLLHTMLGADNYPLV